MLRPAIFDFSTAAVPCLEQDPDEQDLIAPNQSEQITSCFTQETSNSFYTPAISAGKLKIDAVKRISSVYFNASFTKALALPKSIWPANLDFNAPITLPMSFWLLAPTSLIKAAIAACASASLIIFGR